MTFTHALATNNYGEAKFIVSATASNGTHTSIASALTAASSGDTIFIRNGTYTENLTLVAGVNLSAWTGDGITPNVTIIGKCTFTTAGTVTITGIRLQTNSDFLIAVTGSAASILNLYDCYLNCTNNTGISFTSSSGSAAVKGNRCTTDLGTTGIGLFASSSAGAIGFNYSTLGNSGNSSTASTISAGNLGLNYCGISIPITTSSTATLGVIYNNFDTSPTNSTCITHGGSGGSVLRHTILISGTASALSIGAGATLPVSSCTINSSNTNAITGAGTINIDAIGFTGSSSTINTTTQTTLINTAFQKVVVQTFTSTGTYTPTAGMKYCQIEVVGSGGAGGGTGATGASQMAAGGGGGAGGYSKGIFTSATIGASQSVTIGNAGSGVSGNNPGGNGSACSVGALISANGGSGGAGTAAGTSASANGGAGGTAGSGGSFNSVGAPGGNSFAYFTASGGNTGTGGSSIYGGGGLGIALFNGSASTTGTAASNYGSGGAGAGAGANVGAGTGGAGSKGIVVITEYI